MDKIYLDTKLKDCACRMKGIINMLEHNPMKTIYMAKRLQGSIDLLMELRSRLENEDVVNGEIKE